MFNAPQWQILNDEFLEVHFPKDRNSKKQHQSERTYHYIVDAQQGNI